MWAHWILWVCSSSNESLFSSIYICATIVAPQWNTSLEHLYQENIQHNFITGSWESLGISHQVLNNHIKIVDKNLTLDVKIVKSKRCLYLTSKFQSMKLKKKNHSKFNSSQLFINEHPNNLIVGACDSFSLYMKYMSFLSKRRKNTNKIYFHTFYPP